MIDIKHNPQSPKHVHQIKKTNRYECSKERILEKPLQSAGDVTFSTFKPIQQLQTVLTMLSRRDKKLILMK